MKKIRPLSGGKPTPGDSGEGQSQQTITSIRSSVRDYAFALAALFTFLSGAEIVLGQQENEMVVWTAAPSDLNLAVTQVAPADSALSSIEEGRTSLDDWFGWRQWQLKERREAFKDTKFEINLRTYFFDRHQFNGSESEAWAIGGWLGLKTGYFLDHVAFGSTLYTSQPLYAPADRSGSLLLLPNQDGYTVLGEFYADIRIIDGLNINVGAKGYDTPFINRNDVRMTPNTFEAIVLQGRTELGDSSTNAAESDASPNGRYRGPGQRGRGRGPGKSGTGERKWGSKIRSRLFLPNQGTK